MLLFTVQTRLECKDNPVGQPALQSPCITGGRTQVHVASPPSSSARSACGQARPAGGNRDLQESFPAEAPSGLSHWE
jgi:hypothetical protein